MNVRVFIVWLLALLFVVLSGIQVAFSTETVRDQHRSLQAIQAKLDAAAEEYSRLQLELATAAAYQNVERTAQEELGMIFPTDIERVAP